MRQRCARGRSFVLCGLTVLCVMVARSAHADELAPLSDPLRLDQVLDLHRHCEPRFKGNQRSGGGSATRSAATRNCRSGHQGICSGHLIRASLQPGSPNWIRLVPLEPLAIQQTPPRPLEGLRRLAPRLAPGWTPMGCRPLELGRLETLLAPLAASLEHREFLEFLVQAFRMPRRGFRLLERVTPTILDGPFHSPPFLRALRDDRTVAGPTPGCRRALRDAAANS